MSCSRDLNVALRYAMSGLGDGSGKGTSCTLLMFEIRDRSNPLLCGAPLEWVSCFPEEASTFLTLPLAIACREWCACIKGHVCGCDLEENRERRLSMLAISDFMSRMYLTVA